MARKRTPSWMDEILGREGITFKQYIESFGVTDKREFWANYWLLFLEYPEEFKELFGISVQDARVLMED